MRTYTSTTSNFCQNHGLWTWTTYHFTHLCWITSIKHCSSTQTYKQENFKVLKALNQQHTPSIPCTITSFSKSHQMFENSLQIHHDQGCTLIFHKDETKLQCLTFKVLLLFYEMKKSLLNYNLGNTIKLPTFLLSSCLEELKIKKSYQSSSIIVVMY